MNKTDTSSQDGDFFKEIKRGQQKRLEKAVRKAREAVLKNHFPSLENLTLKEIREYERLLDCLVALLLLGIERFFKNLSSPLKEIRERSIWEVFLSGLRYLTRRFPRGYFRKVVINLKEWEGFPEKLDSYSGKCLSSFSDFADLPPEIKTYCRYYNNARVIALQYTETDVKEQEENKNQEEGHEDICRLYASLKSWQNDEQFYAFYSYLEKARDQFFEAFIEGPVQLYLLIGEETGFSVLKMLTIVGLGDFFLDKDKRELQDLRDFHKSVYNLIENSEIYQTFKELVKEALKIYVDDWLKSEKRLRNQCSTDELRRRFVKRFDSGEIFK